MSEAILELNEIKNRVSAEEWAIRQDLAAGVSSGRALRLGRHGIHPSVCASSRPTGSFST